MAVFRVRSEASYRSSTVEVRARFSMTVRWRDALPRRRSLADELSTYTTPAELQDLEAMLEQYDDTETEEIRSILVAQADNRRRTQQRGPFG